MVRAHGPLIKYIIIFNIIYSSKIISINQQRPTSNRNLLQFLPPSIRRISLKRIGRRLTSPRSSGRRAVFGIRRTPQRSLPPFDSSVSVIGDRLNDRTAFSFLLPTYTYIYYTHTHPNSLLGIHTHARAFCLLISPFCPSLSRSVRPTTSVTLKSGVDVPRDSGN